MNEDGHIVHFDNDFNPAAGYARSQLGRIDCIFFRRETHA